MALYGGTVEYWIIAREPISDFFEIGNKFFPYQIEQCLRLALTFLREKGNARQFYGLLNSRTEQTVKINNCKKLM